MITSST